MVKSIFSRVMWVGKATVFMVGLSVILAAIFGVASMAFAANGKPFILGQKNVASKVSQLVGKVAGPSLRISNGSTDSKATALALNVEAGKPPMKVNSSRKVPKLNTDKIDGKDSTAFVQSSTPTYEVNVSQTGSEGFTSALSAKCDLGDKLLSGGVFGINPGHSVFVASEPASVFGDPPGTGIRAWSVWWYNEENPDAGTTGDIVAAIAYCADFGTPY